MKFRGHTVIPYREAYHGYWVRFAADPNGAKIWAETEEFTFEEDEHVNVAHA